MFNKPRFNRGQAFFRSTGRTRLLRSNGKQYLACHHIVAEFVNQPYGFGKGYGWLLQHAPGVRRHDALGYFAIHTATQLAPEGQEKMLIMILCFTDTAVERPLFTGSRIIPGEDHFKHTCIVSCLQ